MSLTLQEYYQTFKRIPPDLKGRLASGEISADTYEAAVAALPPFFEFKSIDELPMDLSWERGDNLEEFASPLAIKGGTLYGAIQDFPRTLRRVGPDSNGSFRPYPLDDVALRIARRHPNNTSIGPSGQQYYSELATEWAVDQKRREVFVRLDPNAGWSDG